MSRGCVGFRACGGIDQEIEPLLRFSLPDCSDDDAVRIELSCRRTRGSSDGSRRSIRWSMPLSTVVTRSDLAPCRISSVRICSETESSGKRVSRRLSIG